MLDEAPHAVWVELGHEHDLVPDEAAAHHRPLGRAVHERGDGQERHRVAGEAFLDHLLRPLDPIARDRVEAATQGEEDVLLPPDHPLGHAGGTPGVEDVEVVGRAGGEVALG